MTNYSFITLNDPAGIAGTITIPKGINNNGQIVGVYFSAPFEHDGFLYSGGSYTTLHDPSAGLSVGGTEVSKINDNGQIVGYYFPSSQFSDVLGFLYTSGGFTTLNDPSSGPTGTEALGINNKADVVGYYYVSGAVIHGFLDSGGSYTTLHDPLAGPSDLSLATGINNRINTNGNSGDIVGTYYDASGVAHGFLYSDGSYTTIDDPSAVQGTPGYGTFPMAINDTGEIVGTYFDASGVAHGFLYNGGSYTTIDDPLVPGGTQLFGINDAGKIVGYSFGSSSARGFLATPGMAPTVSIKPDELLVDDGSPSSPGHATFTVSLDQASTSDLTFNVKLNPPSQTLDSAQEAPVDSVTINSATNTTTSKFTKGEFVAFTSQFKILAGSTSATVDVALRGDTLVEPNEQFSIQIEPTAGENVVMAPGTVIGKNGAPIPGSAIGTILGDGNLATNVTPTFSQTALTALDPTLIPLLTADLQAAAARIEIALGDTVPKFDIQVTTGDLGGPYAKCHPVQTDYTKINGQKVFLPNTLVEHLKGTDPNGTTPDINLTLSTNSQDGVSTWFSGHSQVDVTTMLTHELLHGIGFGAGWSSTPFAGTSKSIWDTFVSSPHGQYVFNGPQAHRVPLATDDNGQLNGHVANLPDLMDPFVGASLPNGMFDEPISPLDVAMLNDIGYGIAPPEWFHPQNPRLIAGVAPDLPPLASTLPAQDGMQGAATYQMTQDTNSAQLNQSVLNLAQSIASFGAARSTSADSFATTLSASAQSMDPILAMPHLHAAV